MLIGETMKLIIYTPVADRTHFMYYGRQAKPLRMYGTYYPVYSRHQATQILLQ